MREERNKDPNFKEQIFRERYAILTKTPEQAILEEHESNLGEKIYLKLWHFFEFISVKPQPPIIEWEFHRAYAT